MLVRNAPESHRRVMQVHVHPALQVHVHPLIDDDDDDDDDCRCIAYACMLPHRRHGIVTKVTRASRTAK